MDAISALPKGGGMIAASCAALGVSRASLHRRARPPQVVRPRAKSARALDANERQAVLDLLREPRFVDLAPVEVYACLLDEGVYLCSIRTMYRILHAHDEVRERRRQLRHPVYQKPELLAEAPNQVWSWDISKLMGPVKWSYFYLYVIIDIFSRRIVGWHVADAETAALFKPLLDDAVLKHDVAPGQLTLHADRGAPMKAKATALLLADLGGGGGFPQGSGRACCSGSRRRRRSVRRLVVCFPGETRRQDKNCLVGWLGSLPFREAP